MVETVRSILETKGSLAWSVAPEATVYEAIELMAGRSVGALVVVSQGNLVGIVSERDYARKVILKGHSSRDTRVEQIMSSPVITVTPDHTVDECLRIATESRIRHLPVLDGGKLAGIVSIGDLVKAVVSAQAATIHQLNKYITGTYPA
jgi:CBS domain-containing protein